MISAPIGRISSPVGSTAHDGLASDEHLGHTRGTAGGDVEGAQPVTLEQEQFMGNDVLADRAHVLVRGDLGADLCDPQL